jgi:hypothetical protein
MLSRTTQEILENKWWARQDSNLEPRDYESPALTVVLQAHACEICCGWKLLLRFHHSHLPWRSKGGNSNVRMRCCLPLINFVKTTIAASGCRSALPINIAWFIHSYLLLNGTSKAATARELPIGTAGNRVAFECRPRNRAAQ